MNSGVKVSLENVDIERPVRTWFNSKCERRAIVRSSGPISNWSLINWETLGRSFSLSRLSLGLASCSVRYSLSLALLCDSKY